MIRHLPASAIINPGKQNKAQSTASITSKKKHRTPGDSKQHKFDTTEVLWHDCGPVVEHPDEIKDDRPNICDVVASARPTKTWENNSSGSISKSRQVGKGKQVQVSR